MATRTLTVPLAAAAADEIVIGIVPRAGVYYQGTAASLTKDGLVPENFEWPHDRNSKKWEAGGLTCWLRRTNPPTMKREPFKAWANCDWWLLRTGPTANEKQRGDAASTLYEARQRYEEVLFRYSPEGEQLLRRCSKAQADKAFHAFLHRAAGVSLRWWG